MRVAWFLCGALAACGAPDLDDPPDPILPATGFWTMVNNSFERIDCAETTNFPSGGSYFYSAWTYSPEDRLLLTWGHFANWSYMNIRCPVNPLGRFVCEPQIEQRPRHDYDMTSTKRIEVSGGSSGGEAPLLLIYDEIRTCEGSDCRYTTCHMRETATLEFQGIIPAF